MSTMPTTTNVEFKVYDGSWGESVEEAISKNYIKHYEYDNFKNIKEISSGCLGKIYRANWKNTHKYIALKSLNNVTEKEIIYEFKLQHEVDFHDNVHLHGITTPNKDAQLNNYMLVMEYTDGTLRDYLKENFNKLAWDNILQLALQLSYSVKRLNDEKIPHCDLNSDGLFVHQNVIKFSDFELSRKANETYTGIIPYIDPKVLKKRRNVNYSLNEKSDVYSIGVLLWELSSGRPPFITVGEPCDIGLAVDILQGLRETPIPNTPDDYIQLYTECWNDDPNERPSVNDVVSRLKTIASQISNNVTSTNATSQVQISNDTDEANSLENEIIKKLVDIIFKLINGGENENEIKDHIIEYINNSNTSLQKIYSWIVNNTDCINSIFILGYFYCYGIGIGINSDKAFSFFTSAVEKNHLLAQFYIGYCHEFGRGTEKDVTLALKYYEKVANENCAAGEFKVGFFYEEEIGVEKDLKLSAYWYKKAADHGNVIAQFNLAKMYKNGVGVDKDYDKAFKIFNQLAEKNYPRGISMLGYCYYNGIGTEIDYQKAIDLYQNAANSGNSNAQYNLANIYENVKFNDIEKAIYWYKKAAEQGYLSAQKKLEKISNVK